MIINLNLLLCEILCNQFLHCMENLKALDAFVISKPAHLVQAHSEFTSPIVIKKNNNKKAQPVFRHEWAKNY